MLMSHDRFREMLELVADAVDCAIENNAEYADDWATAWSQLREWAEMNWPRY